MTWRTVVISQMAKLDLKMGYMVVRTAEQTIKVFIGELAVVLIETTAVSLTASLLAELTARKVKVIFCDEKRNPFAELLPYYGAHDTSSKIRRQISWHEETKQLVWTEIVREKIKQQLFLLQDRHCDEAGLLQSYLDQLEFYDATNREGHAAKVYFNALFGMQFTRTEDIPINAALNYGYGLVLSAVNREIVANGYMTQLGLFHDNMFNPFNLGSDLMEPFRPLVDRCVHLMNPSVFEKNEKMALVNLLNQTVVIDRGRHTVLNAIKIYCKSVFDALDQNDCSLMRFYRNEL